MFYVEVVIVFHSHGYVHCNEVDETKMFEFLKE